MEDHKTKNIKSTRDFMVKSVLISHCGQFLSPEKVDLIARELKKEMENGPCAWAFKI